MPVKNRFAELQDEITAWRRDLHENPEILFETHRTSAMVAEKLQEFGCDEVVTGIGRTGVVGVIKGKSDSSGKVIGLRADMDALPIHEATGLDYASKTPGAMHACGHDGHTAMLLGAAKYLSETRNFDGTTRASECAIAAILVSLGVLEADHPATRKFMNATQYSRRGLECGEIRPAPGFPG